MDDLDVLLAPIDGYSGKAEGKPSDVEEDERAV